MCYILIYYTVNGPMGEVHSLQLCGQLPRMEPFAASACHRCGSLFLLLDNHPEHQGDFFAHTPPSLTRLCCGSLWAERVCVFSVQRVSDIVDRGYIRWSAALHRQILKSPFPSGRDNWCSAASVSSWCSTATPFKLFFACWISKGSRPSATSTTHVVDTRRDEERILRSHVLESDGT